MEASPPGYTTAQWLSDEAKPTGGTILQDEPDEPQDSGLVDHLGRPLYRKPVRRLPVGFLHPYPARS